jgi:hypothetical protein
VFSHLSGIANNIHFNVISLASKFIGRKKTRLNLVLVVGWE